MDCQLFQQPACRQQEGGAEDVECRVCDGDAGAGGGLIQQRRRKYCPHQAEHCQQDGHADHVEHQMNHSSAAGVFVRADRGQQSRHRRADVLSHDDGNGGGIADCAGGGKRL